jgi:hypothetical protein
MKFTVDSWEVINQLLEEEYNSCEDKYRRKELRMAMEELDAIGTQ